MTGPEVVITLEGHRRNYEPGDVLRVEYQVDTGPLGPPRAVEVSVLWHTEGKGDEDLAVHYFNRLSNDEDSLIDFRGPQRFQTTLPRSPLSYDGVIVKLRWCVRVRVFPKRGKELVAEELFRLGDIASAVMPSP